MAKRATFTNVCLACKHLETLWVSEGDVVLYRCPPEIKRRCKMLEVPKERYTRGAPRRDWS